MPNKPHDYKTRIAFAMQLYDTAEPQLSIRQCEKLAGIKHPNLLIALRRRELAHAMRCPTCGRVPGEKISLVRAAQERLRKEKDEKKKHKDATSGV